jgi:hypothetical protein
MKLVATVLLAACGGRIEVPRREAPELDRATYLMHVEPMTDRLCAQAACHGSDERPLRLHARFAWRAEGAPIASALTAGEIDENLDAFALFLDGDPLESELLSKPLRIAAGGSGHRGGGLFYDRADPSYVLFACFLLGGGIEGELRCRP